MIDILSIYKQIRDEFIQCNISKKIENYIEPNTLKLLRDFGVIKFIGGVIKPYEQLEYSSLQKPNIILGSHFGEKEWKTRLDIKNRNIYSTFYENNYKECFINSSYEQTIYCTYLFYEFLKNVKGRNLLGNYRENPEIYGNELERIIGEIDFKATQDGAWQSLIEEMGVGAIWY